MRPPFRPCNLRIHRPLMQAPPWRLICCQWLLDPRGPTAVKHELLIAHESCELLYHRFLFFVETSPCIASPLLQVAFLRDTLGVPAGHVGRVCVAHPRILLAHLRPPPEGTTQAKKGEAGDSPPSITRPTSNGYTRGVASPPPTRPTASAGVGAMRGCACWHALLLYLQRQGMSTEDVALMVQKHPLLLTLDLAVSVSPKVRAVPVQTLHPVGGWPHIGQSCGRR